MSKAWEKGSDTRWRTFRLTILQRDHHQCLIKGAKCTGTATQVDHIVPLHRGGQKYDPHNCRAACATCNAGRRAYATPQPSPRPSSTW